MLVKYQDRVGELKEHIMLFNSPLFLFLFVPIFYFVYYKAPQKLKNLVLLIGSCLFYAWGEPIFIFIAIVSAFGDWVLANFIYKSSKITTRKLLLALSVILNIGLLFYFKYFNFFIANVNLFLKSLNIREYGTLDILLPLAISFIVFEKITYVTDVYRGIGKPAKSLVEYFTYILLFPKLIAGPIIKYHDIQDQIVSREITLSDVEEGFFRFTRGLAKKALIADTMAEAADYIFALAPAQLGFFDAWLGVLCFALQIYFDFSGYSDMAIGLLRTMGFRIGENFNMPYISQNFTEFWRRWHISLSTFIRDYIYIPLGGNRCSQFRQYINLVICFLISGIWHGANWTFVLWGVYHGLFLTIDKALGIKPGARRLMPSFMCTLTTFFLVLISWTIFRAQNISQLALFLSTMFNPAKNFFTYSPLLTDNVVFFLIIGLIISLVPATRIYGMLVDLYKYFESKFSFRFVSSVAMFIIAVGKIATANFNSFIYFRF